MRSRKFRLTIGGGLLMAVCWTLTGFFPALAHTFGQLLGALSGALALYITGNVATKHYIAKVAGTKPNASFQGEVLVQAPGTKPPGAVLKKTKPAK